MPLSRSSVKSLSETVLTVLFCNMFHHSRSYPERRIFREKMKFLRIKKQNKFGVAVLSAALLPLEVKTKISNSSGHTHCILGAKTNKDGPG